METIDFEKILLKTIIPAGLDAKEQSKRIKPLLSYINKRIPSKLYKYRCFCDNHISAFYQDQIWASTAECMNDGFDARLYFKKEDCIQMYERQSSLEQVDEFINRMKTDPQMLSYMSKFPGAEVALQNINLPDSLIRQGITDSKRKMLPVITNMLKNIPVVTQQALKFCCFSETVNSASMWGQYSDNESGFCIEYDFTKVGNVFKTPEGSTVSANLYPMIYKKERYQVPSVFINYMMQYRLFYEIAINSGLYSDNKMISTSINNVLKCPDNLVSTKVALYKSVEWQFEKEWRLFCNAMDDDSFNQSMHCCIVMKPTAVYLGRRVSALNEKIMRMLANEKDIPVYKMELDDNNPTYDLKYQ